ncbi:hypothetical protein [Streptosporangium sp. NPDC020145]|uniref:hypothetical protein n=1 Tax=unclassified Streptosporangium TaxID=2632669 RepID=UPI00343B3CB2
MLAVGCADDGRNVIAREKRCVAQAEKDANSLKDATLALLAPDIAETISENNSCDSGVSGVYLSFEADRSMSVGDILGRFKKDGWEMDEKSEGECSACVAQAGKVVDERYVQVSLLDRPKSPVLEIEISYR